MFDRPEFDSNGERQQILTALDEQGCVVLRNAFRLDDVTKIAARAVARYRNLESFLARGEPYPAPKHFLHRPFNHAMGTAAIYASELLEDAPPAPEIEELFAESPVLPIVQSALGGEVWLWKNACTVRKMWAGSAAPDGQALPLHCDGSTANIPAIGDTLYVCCVPLTDFSDLTPRLEFFVPRHKTLLLPDGSLPAQGNVYAAMEVSEDQVRAAFPDVSCWAPTLSVGDTILFDKYTLHRTYAKPRMTRDRISMDIRFLASGDRHESGHTLARLA
jgi:hypothetical protein